MKAIYYFLIFTFLFSCANSGEKVLVTPDNPNIAYIGRFYVSDNIKPEFMYSGCAIRTTFSGTSVTLLMKDDSLRNMFTILLDDSLFVLTANRVDSTYQLAENLNDTIHHLEIIRRTEWHGGNTTFLGLRIDPKSKVFKPEISDRKIEFIGNSYTCGYGIEGLSQQEDFKYTTENNYLSFGAITARALNAEYLAVCRSGIGIVQGYGGLRKFTMPMCYDEIIMNDSVKWDYTKYKPQLVVIDLIANDLSAPLDSAEFCDAYLKFLERIRKNYAEATIVCIAGPSSPGKAWQTVQNYIHAIVDEFSKQDTLVNYFEFSPFEMHGSDWHPNVTEHQGMSEELAPYLKNLMKW